jgi:glc operon protein GlcG
MRTRFLIALGTCLMLALVTPVIAQQPPAPAAPVAPSAPAAPAPLAAAVSRPDYGPPITIEQAKVVAAAAVAEARKNNYRMAIAIVASTGELVYFEKMDGTQMASIELSLGKARTAVMFRQPSKIFYEQSLGGNMAFMSFPERPVASEGGIPIVVSGKLIGAIGVSGGLAYQDGAVATVGASTAK